MNGYDNKKQNRLKQTLIGWADQEGIAPLSDDVREWSKENKKLASSEVSEKQKEWKGEGIDWSVKTKRQGRKIGRSGRRLRHKKSITPR